MGIFNRFPWSEEHQLNLDWILRSLNDLLIRVKALEDSGGGGGGGGGTSDYNDLNNKPQINDITLEGNKSLLDLGIINRFPGLNLPKMNSSSPSAGNSARFSREDHVHPSDTSRTTSTQVGSMITSALAWYDPAEQPYDPPYEEGSIGHAIQSRASASDVGDLNELYTRNKNSLVASINSLMQDLGYSSSTNLLNPATFTDGYYSSGTWTTSTTYCTSDFIDVSAAENLYIHLFNLNNGSLQDTSRYFQYIYWFDSSKTYTTRTTFTSGTTTYAIPAGTYYARVMAAQATYVGAILANKGFYVGPVDTAVWVPYSINGIPNYPTIVQNIDDCLNGNSVSLYNDVYTITTDCAKYSFQKISDPTINLDTWRLYSGDLINGTSTFNMWHNSDAEGAIRIAGETDYVSGYHGSEVATGFKVFMDGVDITSDANILSRPFHDLAFYVESDVYHCYQDPGVSDTIAFKRNKIVEFTGNKVTVSNSYIAQDTLSVTSARIALFQCYKTDDGTPVFTDFSVNTDFIDYVVANADSLLPTASADMTAAILRTTYGVINFNSILTSGQSYKGSVTNFQNQNRIKFYFDTISQTTSIANGEQIKSQFSFEINKSPADIIHRNIASIPDYLQEWNGGNY